MSPLIHYPNRVNTAALGTLSGLHPLIPCDIKEWKPTASQLLHSALRRAQFFVEFCDRSIESQLLKQLTDGYFYTLDEALPELKWINNQLNNLYGMARSSAWDHDVVKLPPKFFSDDPEWFTNNVPVAGTRANTIVEQTRFLAPHLQLKVEPFHIISGACIMTQGYKLQDLLEEAHDKYYERLSIELTDHFDATMYRRKNHAPENLMPTLGLLAYMVTDQTTDESIRLLPSRSPKTTLTVKEYDWG